MPQSDIRDTAAYPARHKFDRAMRTVNKFDFLSSLTLVLHEAEKGTDNFNACAKTVLLSLQERIDAELKKQGSDDYEHSKHLDPTIAKMITGEALTHGELPADLAEAHWG